MVLASTEKMLCCAKFCSRNRRRAFGFSTCRLADLFLACSVTLSDLHYFRVAFLSQESYQSGKNGANNLEI